jgi:hypothetical protein
MERKYGKHKEIFKIILKVNRTFFKKMEAGSQAKIKKNLQY